jgi:cbb3-type cytochrome oxidase cytochrome c subunit
MGQVLSAFFVLAFLFFGGGWALAQDMKKMGEGRRVFIEKRCYSCHTIKAEADLIEKEKEAFAKTKGLEIESVEKTQGEEEEEGEEDKKIGGDLSHVGQVREARWIEDFINNPKDYFKETPDCKRKSKKMQRRRFKGTDQELAALVSYISGLKYQQEEKMPQSCIKD